MVKKVIVAGLCMALSTVVEAGDTSISESIIGVEVGYGAIQANNQFSPIVGELNHNGSNVEFGLRIGAQQKDWRALFVADYMNSKDDDQKYTKGMLAVDYFILQDSALKPFIGGNAGYMNYESTNIDESGFLYGAQAGLIYRIMDNVEMDMTYRYSLTSANETDHIQGLTFGLNYIY